MIDKILWGIGLLVVILAAIGAIATAFLFTKGFIQGARERWQEYKRTGR